MQATEEISDTISKDTHAGSTIPYGMQGGSPSDGGGAPLNLRHMFRGVRALHGEAGFAALQAAHVMVLGIGGVGSWIAEALCRTAVGELTLVDSDRVAPHDINRQIEATQATLGEIKTHALAVRLTGINPYHIFYLLFHLFYISRRQINLI